MVSNPSTTSENEDPAKAAQDFVEQNQKVAETQLKNLRDEEAKLRSRLQKVEAAIKRWEALVSALNVSATAQTVVSGPVICTPQSYGPPEVLDPIPKSKPEELEAGPKVQTEEPGADPQVQNRSAVRNAEEVIQGMDEPRFFSARFLSRLDGREEAASRFLVGVFEDLAGGA